MKKSIDFALDDHPDHPSDDRTTTAWAVSIADDCEACDDLRVEVTLEATGTPGTGVTAHLSTASARRLHGALAAALKDLGEKV